MVIAGDHCRGQASRTGSPGPSKPADERALAGVEDRAAGVTHLYGNTGSFQFHIDLRGTGLGLSTADFIL